MNTSQLLRITNPNIIKYASCALIALFVALMPAHGQNFEVTPLVGGRFAGTMELQQPGIPNYDAHLSDSVSFGVAAGYRLDGQDGEGHDVIEFRWMRQNSHLGVIQSPPVPSPYTSALLRPSISLDHFLVDFTHEYAVPDAPSIQPFVSGSVGAALMGTPASSETRFAFALGAGVKIFPATHWGFRLKVEYMPIVMHTNLQTLVCAGSCIVVLNGGIMNQFEVSFGPAFRF